MEKNFAEIIPLRRLVRSLGVFDYQVPDFLQKSIKQGQLVQISFQKTDFLGVVVKIKENSSIPQKRLKAITKIVQKEPVITPQQFKLLDWMAGYYFLAPGGILKSMIPDFPKKPATPRKQPQTQKISLKISKRIIPILTKEVNEFLKGNLSTHLLSYPQKSYLFAFYWGVIKKTVNQDKTVLILVPDFQELNRIYSLIATKIPRSQVALIHSNLTSREYFHEWQNVLKNKAKIIVGTRIGCFLPFSKLDVIIVHLEEDENHKQADQNPRFHVREVAKQLSRYYNARLLHTSQTPSFEIFQKKEKSSIQSIALPPSSINRVSLVSLEEELKKKNYSSISDDLQNLISETLKQNKSVFLFLNRRGMARSYLCQDCNWIARCPECELPFTIHEKNYLVCHHCGKKTPMVLKCPRCKGSNLKTMGKGTQRVERELKGLFPNIPIYRIDKDSPQKGKFSGIIIGTEYALRHISFPNFGAMGIISADNYLHLPDFRAEEKTYQLIIRIINFTPQSVPVIIQTFSPENKSIQAAAKQEFNNFAKEELKLREKFHWPPYWQLVKLIYQHQNINTAQHEARKLVNLFKKNLKKQDVIEVLGPSPSHLPRIRGRYRWLVILKTKGGHVRNLKNLVNLVPEDWIIDVDPITLF